MGTLIYGRTQRFEFEDRTLEHIRAAVLGRVRHGDGFFLTWTPDVCQTPGPVWLWISAGMPLEFHFSERTRQRLSNEWLDAFQQSSRQARDLVIVPEPGTQARRR